LTNYSYFLTYYSILLFSNLLPIILVESSIILYLATTHYSQVKLLTLSL